MNRYMQEIADVGQRLEHLGLIAAHSGNISRRLVGGFIITVSGTRKGSINKADVLCMDYQGRPLSTNDSMKIPSSESAMHVALYQAYPQIKAIVHAHPPYATALASTGQTLNCLLTEEARMVLGTVPLLPYLPAGSQELAQAVAQAAKGNAALLLANHGAVSWGESLEEALCRIEILEHTAQVMLYQHLFALGIADV